jgi:TPR repeat protein
MNDMGEHYIVKKEPPEAVKWFRLGAESGNSSAQYNLGLSLANGEGVEVDAVEAHAWWSIAAAQGHVQAKEDLKELEKVMSGIQVIAAQQKAAEFKPQDHKLAEVPLAEPAPSVTMPPAPLETLEHLTTDQRPASGAILTDTLQNQGGRSKLTLDNGLTEDAFVKMISNDKLVASYYVRGGEKFTFDHVPDGVYRLIYCTGFGWDVKKHDFSRGRHAVRYDEILSYSTTRRTEGASVVTSTDELTLTLHKVANGNTKTTDIPLEEFDRY